MPLTLARLSIDLSRHKIALALYLAAPVLEDAQRTHQHERPVPHLMEGNQNSKGLDRLAQSHLVAQKDPLLGKDVFHAPDLIGSQGDLEVRPRE